MPTQVILVLMSWDETQEQKGPAYERGQLDQLFLS